MAELSNLSPRHIVNIEKGASQPSYKTLNNIAAALDVTVPTLLDNDYYDSLDVLKDKILKKLNKLNEKNLRYLYIVASKLD